MIRERQTDDNDDDDDERERETTTTTMTMMMMTMTTMLYYGRIMITDPRERVKQKDGQTDRRETNGRGEADMETARGRRAVQTKVSDAAAKAEETSLPLSRVSQPG